MNGAVLCINKAVLATVIIYSWICSNLFLHSYYYLNLILCGFRTDTKGGREAVNLVVQSSKIMISFNFLFTFYYMELYVGDKF